MDQIYSMKTRRVTVGEGEYLNIMKHQDGNIFDQIITLRDAQRIYNRDRKTILLHCDLYRIRAQKIGRDWLLVRADLDRVFRKTHSL